MRTLLYVTLIATGLGLAGMPTTSAAPLHYTPLPSATETNGSLLQKIYWNRYGQWCSRRCNWRRCWVVCR